jgi:hypothetical protein
MRMGPTLRPSPSPRKKPAHRPGPLLPSITGMGKRVRLALVVALLSGCNVYDASLVPRDAGMDAGADASTSCPPLAAPPTRPSRLDDGTDEAVFALRHITLNQDGDRWRTIGYDLDGLCSGPAEAPVECTPMSGGANASLDGDHGIDNAFGRAITPLLLAAYPTLEMEAQMYQDYGLGTLILRIRNWNGEANDSRVHAILTQSTYGTPGTADGGVPMPEIPDGGATYEDGGVPPFPRGKAMTIFGRVTIRSLMEIRRVQSLRMTMPTSPIAPSSCICPMAAKSCSRAIHAASICGLPTRA